MDTSNNQLLISLDSDGIYHVMLNRAEKLNALSEALLEEIASCFHQAQQDEKIKAVLISAAKDKHFCAGADINELATLDKPRAYDFSRKAQQVFNLLDDLDKPSLAAIDGVAAGGGCELALAASLRIATPTAKFIQPEIALGVIPAFGGTQRLSRLIGKGRALEMCLTGRAITAQQALAWGLLNHVAENDLITESKDLLIAIIKHGPLSIKHILNAINVGYDMPLTDALALESRYFAESCASEEKTLGVEKFLNKSTSSK